MLHRVEKVLHVGSLVGRQSKAICQFKDMRWAGKMVLAQGLDDADRQAPRDEEGDRGAGATVGRDPARIWVDGTEFRWTREQAAAAA